ILDKLNAGIVISGTNVDIRDLDSSQDSIEVLQDTAADLNAAVVNAAGTGLASLSYGSSDGGTTWYPIAVDLQGHLQVDVLGEFIPVPVGTVLPWLKSYTNTPALPDEFVECNGQVLDDGDSVYDGQTIPDLNGGNRFLRGAATSGTTGGAATINIAHAHTQPTHTHSVSDSGNTGYEDEHEHYIYEMTDYPSSTSNAFDIGTGNYAGGRYHAHRIDMWTQPGDAHRHTFSMSDTSSARGDENTGNALSST
ncbi:unnamed protein product, partial [marine sediment metagenome]